MNGLNNTIVDGSTSFNSSSEDNFSQDTNLKIQEFKEMLMNPEKQNLMIIESYYRDRLLAYQEKLKQEYENMYNRNLEVMKHKYDRESILKLKNLELSTKKSILNLLVQFKMLKQHQQQLQRDQKEEEEEEQILNNIENDLTKTETTTMATSATTTSNITNENILNQLFDLSNEISKFSNEINQSNNSQLYSDFQSIIVNYGK
ncbi:hypothetical protein DLAC_07067 [Tieghemostelium lacteum]|uniref:Uncharacterized protein n=1 Tax=Tieghemostelium lacteum TaxID=361077 RepID=A0A151ZE48_TIELA|nr:hypothetical protein DLAC_07067 [Tieghemostelium lacteum]|eukprot:KYQ92221.1 hypothetical protein DLAC_07067 [Tieghemostelium lacteum]